jgi:hypothetical protein
MINAGIAANAEKAIYGTSSAHPRSWRIFSLTRHPGFLCTLVTPRIAEEHD